MEASRQVEKGLRGVDFMLVVSVATNPQHIASQPVNNHLNQSIAADVTG